MKENSNTCRVLKQKKYLANNANSIAFGDDEKFVEYFMSNAID